MKIREDRGEAEGGGGAGSIITVDVTFGEFLVGDTRLAHKCLKTTVS